MAAKNKKPMKGSIGTSFIIEKIPATRRCHVASVFIIKVMAHV